MFAEAHPLNQSPATTLVTDCTRAPPASMGACPLSASLEETIKSRIDVNPLLRPVSACGWSSGRGGVGTAGHQGFGRPFSFTFYWSPKVRTQGPARVNPGKRVSRHLYTQAVKAADRLRPRRPLQEDKRYSLKGVLIARRSIH